MHIQLFSHQWLSLSNELKAKLIKVFDLKKSGVVEVANRPTGSVVLADGFTNENLAGITIEKMQNFLKSAETDFYKLFEEVEIKLKDELHLEKKAKEAAEPKEPTPVTAESVANAINNLAEKLKPVEVKPSGKVSETTTVLNEKTGLLEKVPKKSGRQLKAKV